MKVNIPDGFIHHPDLKARGWTNEMIDELLPADATIRIDVPNGTSPRAFRLDAVETAEAADPDRFAQIAAAQAQAEADRAAAPPRAGQRRDGQPEHHEPQPRHP